MFKFALFLPNLLFFWAMHGSGSGIRQLTITAAISNQDLKLYLLKGLSHKMGLALDDMYGLKVLGAPMILLCNKCIPRG